MKSTLKEQNIDKNYRNLVDLSLAIGIKANYDLLEHTLYDRLIANESLLSLIEVRFRESKFSKNKLESNIKYYHLSFEDINFFQMLNNPDYILTNYFAKSEII